MSAEENKKIVQRFYDTWVSGDWEGMKGIIAPDVVDHNAQPGQAPGREGMLDGVQVFAGGFPDLRFNIDRYVAEGDLVVVQGRASGTHKGNFAGIPPTNKATDGTFTSMFRVASGKIAEVWHIEDVVSLMQQIGVMPQPGSQTAMGTSDRPAARSGEMGRQEPGMTTPPM